MTRFLFGSPADWSSRHPRLMLAAVLVLVATSQWLVDVLLQVGMP